MASREDELREELGVLDEFEQERLARAEAEREQDRARGKQRGEELFGEGSLGSVREDTSPEVEDLMNRRQQALAELKDTDVSSERRAELERVTQDFDRLIDERTDPRNAANIAAREQGIRGIDRQTATNLRRVAALSNESGTRLSMGLTNDALQTATQQRRELEQNLIMSGRDAEERLTKEGAQARASNLSALEDQERAKREEIENAQRRLEDLQGAIEQDVLNRQVFNIQARRQEVFGRLATEEGTIAQGIAERTGERQQLLSQANAVDQRGFQKESLDIQRIEANKPPPSGGGKSILCIQFWLTGDISDEILKGDFKHTINNPAITDEVRTCYYFWSSWIAPHVEKRGLVYHIMRPMVVRWANEMAYKAGVEGAKPSWFGQFASWIGTPIHQCVGKLLNWAGWSFESIDSSQEVRGLFHTAQDLWHEAHKEVGRETIRFSNEEIA